MKTKSPQAFGLALLLSSLISISADPGAAPQPAGVRAGEVSRVIPAVNIARGGKALNTSAKTPVDWQDLVNTQSAGGFRQGHGSASSGMPGVGPHLGVWGDGWSRSGSCRNLFGCWVDARRWHAGAERFSAKNPKACG